jgi:hypothetical protein
MTSMDKISSQQPLQSINESNPRTSLAINQSQKPTMKKNICSKSLIYPLVAWSLFIILTILYFIFV